MIELDKIPACDPKCPICHSGMGTTINADWEPSNIAHWCDKCNLSHFIDKKYWIWKGSRYTEEQFERVLELKAFW